MNDDILKFILLPKRREIAFRHKCRILFKWIECLDSTRSIVCLVPRTINRPFCRMKCSIFERSSLAIIMELSPLRKQFFPPQHSSLFCLCTTILFRSLSDRVINRFFFSFIFSIQKRICREMKKKLNKFDVVYLLFIGQVLSIGCEGRKKIH